MAFLLEFSAEAEHDFGLNFDHLLRSYLGFGESLESALDRGEGVGDPCRRGADFDRTPPGRAA